MKVDMKFPPHIEVVGGDLERETSKEGVWCVRGRWVKHWGEGHNGSEGDGEKNVLSLETKVMKPCREGAGESI